MAAVVLLLNAQRAEAVIFFGGYDSYSLGVLWRADSDGSHAEELLREWPGGVRLAGISQLAVDADAQKIYWAGGGIQRANFDGTGLENVIREGAAVGNAIWGVALDTAGHKLYWVDRDLGKMWRANLDGSGIETVLSGLQNPRHLAIDAGSAKEPLTNNFRTSLSLDAPCLVTPDANAEVISEWFLRSTGHRTGVPAQTIFIART